LPRGGNGYPAGVELLPTLKKAAAALERDRVPYLLGGSLACWARGGPAVAGDLDFMVKPADAERALAALVGIGMREDDPPEQWLLKAWDGDHMVDLIFEAAGLPITDEVFARAERMSVGAMTIPVMALEDVLTTMLWAMNERSLDYEHVLQIARSLREQIDWDEVRARTAESPYAAPFFTLVERLGICPRLAAPETSKPRIRVA
jgi:Nucleotidyl transferase of unknown function (DUF2204)